MKVYKKIMNGLAFVEKLVLVLSTILIVGHETQFLNKRSFP